tara:strand:- start:1502 stop:1996 length:495 start_codon:yes stop_codon:yes gene_type:complete
MREEYRDIKGYEGHYKVSDLGRVKSVKFGKNKILKQFNTGSGYCSATLVKDRNKKNYTVHQLVAIAFLGHKPNGHKTVVDHIDNDKLNNNLYNLQLISHRENSSKDKKGGSSDCIGVVWNKLAKKWRARIYINGRTRHLGLFADELEASESYQNELKEINNERV